PKDALQKELPFPEIPEAPEVVPAERRVEHLGWQERGRVPARSEAALDDGEAWPAGRDGHEPPWVHQDVELRPQREPGVGSEAGPEIPFPLPRDREVARDDERLEARFRRAPDQPLAHGPLL